MKTEKITTITLDIFKLNGQLIEWGNHFCEPFGLTSARWQILGAISLMGSPSTIPQIAEYMGVSRQGALKQIQYLEKNDWVIHQKNPQHKRSPLYLLTDKGETTYTKIFDRWQQHIAQMAQYFSDDDLKTTQKTLKFMEQFFPKSES